MPLMAHEAHDLHELLMGCYNSVTCMGIFVNQAKDPELKSMIEKHMAAHIQDYNMKVEWARNASSNQQLNVPPVPAKAGGTPKPPQQGAPNPDATAFDDRAIGTSYLVTVKRSGKDYASAAFEASDPQLRKFLEDAFTMCSRHAYEAAEWMSKNGYYPSEQASAKYLQALNQTYEPVQQLAAVH
jgi:spore coat protein CotF